MKDRVVQFPHRYQLVPVDGEMNVYDFVPVPGTVTEEGTSISKATLLSDETAACFELTGNDAVVDKALKKALSLSSYMAFCGNVNSDMLDAAFGKNNEAKILNIGNQIDMYAKYKSSSAVSMTNTILKSKLSDILSDPLACIELFHNLDVSILLGNSPYAYNTIFDYEGTYIESISQLSGASSGFATLESLFSNTAAIDSIASSIPTIDYIVNNPACMNWAIKSQPLFTAMCATPISRAHVIAGAYSEYLWRDSNASLSLLGYATITRGTLDFVTPYGGLSWQYVNSYNTDGIQLVLDLTDYVGRNLSATCNGYYRNSSGSLFNSKKGSLNDIPFDYAGTGVDTKSLPIITPGEQILKFWATGGSQSNGYNQLYKFSVI